MSALDAYSVPAKGQGANTTAMTAGHQSVYYTKAKHVEEQLASSYRKRQVHQMHLK